MYPSENIITTSSLFHFPFPSPSPYLSYGDDVPVFLQNLDDLLIPTDINSDNSNMSTQIINNNNTTDSTTSTILDPLILKQAADQSTKRDPKRRSSKKDRHSKINTAHGPRDRRMRLSLDVARKFFGLQDILGFDKASKTVEWLLTQSKSAIKDLSRAIKGLNSNHSSSVGANSTSSTSECEVLSGTDEPRGHLAKAKGKGSGSKDKKRKAIVRRVAFDSTARELRVKARERARERTTRKRKLEIGELNLSQLGCPSRAQNGSCEVQLAEVDKPSSRDERQVDHEQGSSRDHDMIFGDSFWSSSLFFNDQHNSTASHEFAEFQVYGKPWDQGYNN